jgi:hypothetical protein
MHDAARAPVHDAPPPLRPVSMGAVAALGLALVLAIPAFIGAWWLEILPLAVGAASWWAIADGRRRGRGVVILACVLAAVAGTTALLWLGGARRGFEGHLDLLLRALAKDDRAELSAWVLDGEDRAAAVARWRERMQAAEREAGAYGQRVEVAWGLWGPAIGLITPPDGDLVEIGAPPGAEKPAPGSYWVRAAFAREHLWAAIELGRKGSPLSLEDVKRAPPGDRIPFLREVRFFRAPRAP